MPLSAEHIRTHPLALLLEECDALQGYPQAILWDLIHKERLLPLVLHSPLSDTNMTQRYEDARTLHAYAHHPYVKLRWPLPSIRLLHTELETLVCTRRRLMLALGLRNGVLACLPVEILRDIAWAASI
jgi:hypothetical protein